MTFQEMLTFVVPILVIYNGWLHKMVIDAQTNLAVLSERNRGISDNIEELKGVIKELNTEIKSMKQELHNFMIKK